MAEAAWRSLPAELQAGAQAFSAGLMASEGARAAKHSIAIAQGWNVDLNGHRARRIDDDMLADLDVIATMTADAAEMVRQCFPEQAAKVHVLGKFSKYAVDAAAHAEEVRQLADLIGIEAGEVEGEDIDDPYGGSLQDYELAAAQIRRAVEGLAIAIQQDKVGQS